MTLKKSLLIFFLIILLGLFLRVYKLGNQSFIADENIGIKVSYGYNQTGQWSFWDFNNDKLDNDPYNRSNIYYWQVAKLFDFVEVNETNSRLISVAWGMVGVLLIFIATYYYTKKPYIALISALLLSVSISALLFDRKLRMYSMFSPVFFAFCIALYQFFESKFRTKIKLIDSLASKTGLNWMFLPLVLGLGYVSLRTHLLTVNIIPIAVAYLLIMAIIYFIKNKNIFNKYLALILIGLTFMFFVKDSHYIKDALLFFSWQDNWGYFEKIFLDYDSYMLSGILLVIGSIFLIKKYKKWGGWTCCCFWVPLTMAIFSWDRNVGDQYIYFIQIFKDIIIASAIFLIAREVSNSRSFSNHNKKIFFISVFVLLVMLFNFKFFFSKDSYYMDISKWNHSNHREAHFYILNNFGKNEVLISRSATNFYLWKKHIPTIDYGVSDDLSLSDIQEAQKKYKGIWLSYSRDTDIDSDAKEYIENNFNLKKTEFTNKKVLIWHWKDAKK